MHVRRACLLIALLAGCRANNVVAPIFDMDPPSDLAAPLDLARPDLARVAPPDLATADAASACFTQFGAGMSAAFGRIDGTLLAVVTPTDPCPHDDNHVILDVRMNGSVYELWVNIGSDLDPMSTYSQSAALGAPAYSEGWHTDAALDYVQTFGLTSSAFTVTPPAGVIQQLAMLPVGEPISVYATGYGPDGGHDIHRQATGQDGAVVLSPATAPRYLLYHFDTQSF
jgi:hypothetical protein